MGWSQVLLIFHQSVLEEPPAISCETENHIDELFGGDWSDCLHSAS